MNTDRTSEEFFDGPNPTTRLDSDVEAAKGANRWILHTHPEYDDLVEKWEYVEDHYTGSLLDKGKIEKYLIQRAQAEHENEYAERKKLATQPYHLAYLIDTFAGMIFAADRNVARMWQEDENDDGLGSEDDPDTMAGRLWRDADGTGTNYIPFWQRFVTSLIRLHRMYVLVEGVDRDSDGRVVSEPHYRSISPLSVTNWRYDGRTLVDVVVKHKADVRTSITEKPSERERYTHYHLEGFDVYDVIKDEQGEKRVVFRPDMSGPYEYYEGPDSPDRTLPIFRVDLPFSRYLAYQAARRVNSVFNMESERDTALRHGNIARLAIVGTESFYEGVEKALALGFKLIRHDPENATQHYYMTPPDAPARLATDVIEKRVADFLFTTFREYGDAAREKTATEINQDRRAGLEAFLHIVVASLTEAENQALRRLEQVAYPNTREKWGIATVEREPDFQYVATAELVATISDKIFGAKPIPAGATAMRAAAASILGYYGIDYDEGELEAAIDAQAAGEAQAQAALSPFGL